MAEKIKFQRDDAADYEPTDSEEEYSEEEKEILKEVRKGRQRNDDGRKELMAFADSDDDDDDDDGGDVGEQDGDGDESDDDEDDMDELMRDSDIEGAGNDDDDADMPNEMDWGKKSRNYYNTDFVDPDYTSYTPEQEELAKQEEEEARAIQQRLAKEMTEKDFQLDESLFEEVKKEKAREKHNESSITTTKLKADFSGLSKREKQQLFQKDSPEFAPLVNDFREFMKEVECLHNPVLEYVKQKNLPLIPAFEFAQVYRSLALTYCSNISFYLLLKTKRISIRNHPIAKRLAQFKNLLLQLQDKYKNIIRPQLEALLERIQDGDQFEVLPIRSALSKAPATSDKKKGSKLSILSKYGADLPSSKVPSSNADALNDNRVGGALDSSDDDEEADEEASDDAVEYAGEDGDMDDEEARRGITYEIAKNKGLTPHRKKEMRNPRVKHRNRFRKALIRRKGAVRTVRKETKRYGGEISGIKATVSKSIKFKS